MLDTDSALLRGEGSLLVHGCRWVGFGLSSELTDDAGRSAFNACWLDACRVACVGNVLARGGTVKLGSTDFAGAGGVRVPPSNFPGTGDGGARFLLTKVGAELCRFLSFSGRCLKRP